MPRSLGVRWTAHAPRSHMKGVAGSRQRALAVALTRAQLAPVLVRDSGTG